MDHSSADREIDERYWSWGTAASRPRILHVMLRVSDLDRSLHFYCSGLGMKVLDLHDFEAGRFTLAFLSYGGYDDGPAIELTHNWDSETAYSHGTGYGHVAIGVPNIDAMCDRLAEHGAEVTVAPKQMVAGAPKLAFLKDPDGYMVELIQTRI